MLARWRLSASATFVDDGWGTWMVGREESVEGRGASTMEEKERKADAKDGEKGKEKETERLDDVPHAHNDLRRTPPVESVRPTAGRKRRRREGESGAGLGCSSSNIGSMVSSAGALQASSRWRKASDASQATTTCGRPSHPLEATSLRNDEEEGEKDDGNALESGDKERQHHCSSTLRVQASRRIRNEMTDLVPLLSLLPLPPRHRMAPNNNKAQKRLKVSVRRLPADLPEEVFWRTAAPWVSKGEEGAEGEGQGEGEAKEGAEKAVWAEYKQGIVRKRFVSLPWPSFERSESRRGGGTDDEDLHTAARTRTASIRELTSPSSPSRNS